MSCVLSGRGLCEELITRPEESYRLWCFVVCDLETLWKRKPYPIVERGGGAVSRQNKTKLALNLWQVFLVFFSWFLYIYLRKQYFFFCCKNVVSFIRLIVHSLLQICNRLLLSWSWFTFHRQLSFISVHLTVFSLLRTHSSNFHLPLSSLL